MGTGTSRHSRKLVPATSVSLVESGAPHNHALRPSPEIRTHPPRADAYVQTGGFYGDNPAVMGGYVGTANYIVTDGTVTTNTNDFYLATDVTDARVQRLDSPYGAPSGPWSVCISEVVNGACGAARSFKEGAFKFSVYGYTTGSAYALPDVGGATPTEFGVRMTLKLVGATGDIDLHFNNDPTLTLAKLGSTSVTSFTLGSGALGSITYAFQTKYNIGAVPSSGNNGTVPTPTATKDVKIRASAVPNEETSIYVDYLFIASDFAVADKCALIARAGRTILLRSREQCARARSASALTTECLSSSSQPMHTMPRVCFPNRLHLRPVPLDQGRRRSHVCGDEAGHHGRRDGARWRRRYGHDVLNAMARSLTPRRSAASAPDSDVCDCPTSS